eukprot:5887339-Amphidinium_carterae.1
MSMLVLDAASSGLVHSRSMALHIQRDNIAANALEVCCARVGEDLAAHARPAVCRPKHSPENPS